ncbi:hypothetical protein HK096_002154 [Nowakowskiella sp. JEL0078]|nr:hypothetical protein HK096_002154 [Nowakowskiella sp. JEL0078]
MNSPEILQLSPPTSKAFKSNTDTHLNSLQTKELKSTKPIITSIENLRLDDNSHAPQSQQVRSSPTGINDIPTGRKAPVTEITHPIQLCSANLVWDAPPQTVLIVTKFWDAELVYLTRVVSKWLIEMGMTVIVEDRLKDNQAFEYETFFNDSSETEEEISSSASSTFSIFDSPTLDSSPLNNSQSILGVSNHALISPLQFWNADLCETMNASSIDFIITLGGDGTVLFAAWLFQRKVPPIIPFHLGSLGFLGVFDFSKFRLSIMRILESNNVRMNFRMRFACTIYRKVKSEAIVNTPTTSCGTDEVKNDHEQTFQILNDLVVDRGPSPYMSQLELFGNDKHLTTVQADGLVVGTPTGSTAYSLSAGGSVLHPDVSAILITPICPHTLSFRPMILPDTMELEIFLPDDSRATAWASFDGRRRVQLRQGDSIKIVASNYPVPTVCLEDQSTDWFQGLERCLGWNRRERQKALVEETIGIKEKRALGNDEW